MPAQPVGPVGVTVYSTVSGVVPKLVMISGMLLPQPVVQSDGNTAEPVAVVVQVKVVPAGSAGVNV